MLNIHRKHRRHISVSTPTQPPTIPPTPQLYQVMTDRQIHENLVVVPKHSQFYHSSGADWRAGDPAVFWLFGGTSVTFTEKQQWLAWDMVKDVMSTRQFTILYDKVRAFNNFVGFCTPGTSCSDPRHNYVTNEYTNYPDPAWDKVRVCAGAKITGVEDGDWLIVSTLDPSNPPTWEKLQKEPWHYFYAVSSTKTGDTTPFPQGNGNPVPVPLFARTEVRFPLSALIKL